MALDMAPSDYDEDTERLFEEEQLREENERIDRLDRLGQSLMKKARETSSARSVVEQRWLEDIRQYNGRYSADIEQKLIQGKKSRVFLGLTRSKTNIAESRIADMLFPTDDRNWEVNPSPVPDMQKDPKGPAIDEATGQPVVDDETGEPLAREAVAEELLKTAKDRANLMQAEIDDQLNEADYSLKSRESIHQACVLGSGVLKGPIVVGRTRRAWTVGGDGQWTLSQQKEFRPSVEVVDVWDFFPDMSVLRFKDCEFAFERRFLTKKQLRELRDNPYYIASSIDAVMEMDPRQTVVGQNHVSELRMIHGTTGLVDDTRYESWVYNGPINCADLKDAGIELEDYDEKADLYGTVEVCGSKVIKADLNPLDSGELPYSMYVYERDETCIFGFGVPYQVRDPQRVANSAWRMLLDNLGLSVAPQTVINRGKLDPADGNWELSPGKLWVTSDASTPLNNLFAQFSIDPHQVELTALLKDAMQLMDETSNLPLIAQGQQTPLTKTAGGMAMLMNAANTVLRRSVKEWDDGVTRPMLTRFYDYNMQYSEREDIKGDYEVDARGASVLLAKEIQAQNLMQLAANFLANPLFAPMFKSEGLPLMRKVIQSQHLAADDLIKNDQEWKAMQDAAAAAAAEGNEQPDDPRVAAAQLAAQAKMQELEYERETKQIVQEGERELEYIRLAQNREMSLESLKAKLAQTQMKIEGDVALQGREIATKQAFGSGL